MKRRTVPQSLVLLAAFAVLPCSLQAQEQTTATASVKGVVRHINSVPMNFGELDPTAGTDRTISPLQSVGVLDAMAGNAGSLDYRINKTGDFQFTMPGVLDSTTSTETLTVNAWTCGLQVGDDATTVTDPLDVGSFSDSDLSGTCGALLTADMSAIHGARLIRVYFGGTILGADYDLAPAETFVGDVFVLAGITP